MRAYQLKKALRAVLAGVSPPARSWTWLSGDARGPNAGRIPEFIRAVATIRTHKDGIAAAIERELSNGRREGLNNMIRTLT